MMILQFDPKIGVWAENPDDFERLVKNFFGDKREGKIYLLPEEALYLMTFLNAECFKSDEKLGFNQLAEFFAKSDDRLL